MTRVTPLGDSDFLSHKQTNILPSSRSPNCENNLQEANSHLSFQQTHLEYVSQQKKRERERFYNTDLWNLHKTHSYALDLLNVFFKKISKEYRHVFRSCTKLSPSLLQISREKSDTRHVTNKFVSLTNETFFIDSSHEHYTTQEAMQQRCWRSGGTHGTRSWSYEGPEIASPNIERTNTARSKRWQWSRVVIRTTSSGAAHYGANRQTDPTNAVQTSRRSVSPHT
jgi:hypothetical protein